MPQLGETVAEGKISKWFVSAGDAVKPGDNLFEIETDKVSMEVPAIAAGTLAAIHVQAGDVAPVGAVVAVILGKGEAAAPSPPKAPLTPAKRREAPSQTKTRGSRKQKNWVPAFAGTSGAQPQPSPPSQCSRSARCARPSATTARPGLRAAPRSRRSRAGSRAKPGSI